MRVHLQDEWDPAAVERLRSRLGEAAHFSVGGPIPRETEVLVGNPSTDDANALSIVRAILIPWAGVPESALNIARSRPGIRLFNLHHNAGATAEMAFALLLAVAKRIPSGDRHLRQGRWEGRQGNGGWLGLDGRTAVILGYGSIGRRLGRLCRAAGMRVIGVRTQASGEDEIAVEQLGEVLPQAHALLICAPLTAATLGLMEESRLALLPPDAVLVNVGRGPIVKEDALYACLVERRIFGAGLDVWYQYPKGSDVPAMPSRLPFHELDNVVMSPHHGGNVSGIDDQRMDEVADVLVALLRGEPVPNEVDLDRGY